MTKDDWSALFCYLLMIMGVVVVVLFFRLVLGLSPFLGIIVSCLVCLPLVVYCSLR